MCDPVSGAVAADTAAKGAGDVVAASTAATTATVADVAGGGLGGALGAGADFGLGAAGTAGANLTGAGLAGAGVADASLGGMALADTGGALGTIASGAEGGALGTAGATAGGTVSMGSEIGGTLGSAGGDVVGSGAVASGAEGGGLMGSQISYGSSGIPNTLGVDGFSGAAPSAGGGFSFADVLSGVKTAGALAGPAMQLMGLGASANAARTAAARPVPQATVSPVTAMPVQSQAQGDKPADISEIRKKNSILFANDSASSTNITGGNAGSSSLGRATLLGGTSKLGG